MGAYGACGQAILVIMDIVESGYLSELPGDYVDILSSGLARFSSHATDDTARDMVTFSIDILISSLQSDMVQGQSDVIVTTSGFTVRIGYDVATELGNTILWPPRTEEEEVYNLTKSYITLPSDGLQACGSSDNGIYSQYSILEYSSRGNPYNTSALQTSLLRFSSTTDSPSPNSENINFEDTFSFVAAFNEPQIFNSSNATPICTRLFVDNLDIATSNTTYVPYCNVTDFTPYNMTCVCANITAGLCSAASVNSGVESSRTLGSRDRTHKRITAVHFADTHRGERRRNMEDRRHRRREIGTSGRRRLQIDVEDSAASSSDTEVSQYGGLTTSAGALIEAPFIDRLRPSDFARSIGAISFTGTLVFLLVAGYFYFAWWDGIDKNYHKYIVQAEKRTSRGKKTKKKARNDGEILASSDGKSRDSARRALSRAFSSMSSSFKLSSANSRMGFVTTPEEVSTLEELVVQFFDNVLNSTGLLTQRKRILRFRNAVLREHPWIRPFTYPSIRVPRTIRYLNLCTEVMIIIFLDSLFFGLFYPDDATCQQHSGYDGDNEYNCLHEQSRAFGQEPMCRWVERNHTCELEPPPETLLFFVVLTVIITVFAAVPKACSYYLLMEVCSKQPDFEQSGLPDWFTSLFDWWIYRHKNDDLVRISELGKTVFADDCAVDEANDHLAILRYYDVCSADEELDFVVRSIKRLLNKDLLQQPLPWHIPNSADLRETDGANRLAQLKRREAIMNFIGLNPDGSPCPLTWYQWILFGSHEKYLRSKLCRVRRKYASIVEELSMFDADEEDNRDTLLMQHFVLDQMPPLQRLALEQELFQFDMSNPEKIDCYYWMGGWVLQYVLLLFMFTWVLLWAVSNGNAVFKVWAIQVVFALIEDFFVAQLLLIIIVHVVAIEYMQPQLRHIYNALNQVTVKKVLNNWFDSTDVKVVQHFSAACRASRVEAVRHLPSSRLLNSINDDELDIIRQRRRSKLPFMGMILVGLPTLFGLAGEDIQSMFFDIIVSIIWGSFLLLNNLMLSTSVYLLVAVYVVVTLCTVYYVFVMRPSRASRRAMLTRAKDPMTGWKSVKILTRAAANPLECVKDWFIAKWEDWTHAEEERNMSRRKRCRVKWRNMNLLLRLPDQTPHDFAAEDYYDEVQMKSTDDDQVSKKRDSLDRLKCVLGGVAPSHSVADMSVELSGVLDDDHSEADEKSESINMITSFETNLHDLGASADIDQEQNSFRSPYIRRDALNIPKDIRRMRVRHSPHRPKLSLFSTFCRIPGLRRTTPSNNQTTQTETRVGSAESTWRRTVGQRTDQLLHGVEDRNRDIQFESGTQRLVNSNSQIELQENIHRSHKPATRKVSKRVSTWRINHLTEHPESDLSKCRNQFNEIDVANKGYVPESEAKELCRWVFERFVLSRDTEAIKEYFSNGTNQKYEAFENSLLKVLVSNEGIDTRVLYEESFLIWVAGLNIKSSNVSNTQSRPKFPQSADVTRGVNYGYYMKGASGSMVLVRRSRFQEEHEGTAL